MICTGFRISELLKLKTKNVDLKNRILIGGSKTKAGINRKVPISKHIFHIIERMYDPDNEFLVMDTNNTPVHYQRIWKWWKRTFKDRTIHETRHTFITFCNNAECNKLTVQAIVGHASKDITDDIYSHKNITELHKTIAKFDEYLCLECVL